MSQAPRQKLLQAFKEWFLSELGVMQLLSKLRQEIMIEFSRYKLAVNTSLEGILQACLEERTALQALMQAWQNQNEQEIDAAIAELSNKQQQIVDAVTGIISSVPSPTSPSPTPPPTGGTIPDLVVPEIPLPTPIAGEDPQVPIVIEPSPEGVGVDGGFNISE